MAEITWDQIDQSARDEIAAFWNDRTPIANENDQFSADREFAQSGNFDASLSMQDAYMRLALQPITQTPVNLSINGGGLFGRTFILVADIYVREGTETALANTLLEDFTRFLSNPGAITDTIIRNVVSVNLGSDGVWFQRSITADLQYWTDLPASAI